MSMTGTISIIVTTYNWPAALKLVLLALNRQNDDGFEVIVADDGSTVETRHMIDAVKPQLSYPIKHYWQEDDGFRAARSRNRSVLESSGDYLVFLDGDCIPRRDFVSQHRRLAISGWFVRGNRVKLYRGFTDTLTASGSIDFLDSPSDILFKWLKRDIARLLPLARFPLGVIREYKRSEWEGVKTCNLGVFREDFVEVNGFNEAFHGWGHEDADLAIRLIRSGVRRREGTFATTVFHCWHEEQDRSNESRNREMLEQSFHGELRPLLGLYQGQYKLKP